MRSLVVAVFLVGCGAKPELLGDGGPPGDASSRAHLTITPPMADIASLKVASFAVANDGQDPTASIGLEIMGVDSLDFQLRQPTCTILTPGASCTVDVFSFGRTFDAKAELHAYDSSNASDVNAKADLASSGQNLTIDIPTIPGTPINGTSPVIVATISNPTMMASGPLTIAISDPEFTQAPDASADSCSGKSLAANGGSCTYSFLFAPTGSATNAMRTGSMTATGMVSGQQDLIGTIVPLVTVDRTQVSGPLLTCAVPSDGIVLTFTNPTGLPFTGFTQMLNGNTGQFAIHGNTCTPTLGAGQTCTLTVGPSLQGAGSQNTSIVATATQGNVTAVVTTSINVNIGCDFTVMPDHLTFIGTALNTQSPAQKIIVANTSLATMSHLVTSMASGTNVGQFIIADGCNGTTLAPNTSCMISVAYKPTLSASASATVSVSTPGRTPYSVPLTGAPLASTMSISPTSASYPPTAPTAMSAPQSFIVRSAIATGAITVSTMGPYTITSNTCNSLTGSGDMCTVDVAFSPGATGTTPGSVTASAGTASATAMLVGTGAPSIAISPSYATLISSSGAASQPQTFTVSNLSGQTTGLLLFNTMDVSFSTTNNGCSMPLAVNGTCTFSVIFTSTNGPRTSTLSVSTTPGGMASALLTGEVVP